MQHTALKGWEFGWDKATVHENTINQRIVHVPNCTVMKWSQSIFILKYVHTAEYCMYSSYDSNSYLSMYVGLVVYKKFHSASLPSSSSTVQGSLVTELSINLCMEIQDHELLCVVATLL